MSCGPHVCGGRYGPCGVSCQAQGSAAFGKGAICQAPLPPCMAAVTTGTALNGRFSFNAARGALVVLNHMRVRAALLFPAGGSYHLFAGRDASRALATMNLSEEALTNEWDDLADLAKDEKQILREWEEKFVLKYKCIGALLHERDKTD